MSEFWWSVALATLGVAVPGIVALYEFVLKGRKRLGYRVQMDTTATDVVRSSDAGALEQLQKDGRPLDDPTLVLLRVENSGATNIDTHDYAVLDDDKVGVRVRFPGRTVAGLVVTELSDEFLRASFQDGSGLAVRDGVIELPKVPLNRAAHYKVLAALEREPGSDGTFGDPEVVGGIKGGIGGGRITETRSRTGTPRRTFLLIGFLILLVIAQLGVFLLSDAGAPLDCARGRAVVTGSTAFAPVLTEAAAAYMDTCSRATIVVTATSSGDGLAALHQSRDTTTVAFSDGPKADGYPALLPRPVGLLLFTLIVHPGTGVYDLGVADIRRLESGQVTNWSEIGGNDVPVRLVQRQFDSGTRKALQRQVLAGYREPGSNSDDCKSRDPGSPPGVVRCERRSTDAVLRAVAGTPGALGYAEVGAASRQKGVAQVRIGGARATLAEADQGSYPYWATEYGYTYGEPPPRSAAASFMRYLTDQVGADILRAHGERPCSELQNPATCRPAGG